MVWGIAKVIIAGSIISFTSWLSGKRPGLAGFLLALPISSMIALMFSYSEYRDSQKSIEFAKSVLVAVPLSLTFFVPFLFADRLKLSFVSLYILGVVSLVIAYVIHRSIFGNS